jgi:hypothetical protein
VKPVWCCYNVDAAHARFRVELNCVTKLIVVLYKIDKHYTVE